ncbi:selenocysteine-specific translation elongation factor [Gordonia sp. CPCC 205515]|uniref:selenocysteine-specific translation elongation factor n=1 Tax=Gordonia sp. CPCC 205515 TaxID=3140791 RepID=UPI003AF3373E
MRYVVATAGHVDHGKSTLVKALTGIEPDRWAEERRRGLTIDLGFAWTTLSSGADVAFVDVPGHERFIANMLAGLGPAPIVLFVIAADEGWRAQSADHRDALAALGIDRGIVVISRADRASTARVDEVIATVRTELADTGLAGAPTVVTSAVTGQGIDELRTTLDEVLATTPEPVTTGRVRLWLDRAFSITGAGTVVTGTLSAGTISAGDTLELVGDHRARTITVRGVQSENVTYPTVGPVSRVAVNTRGVSTDDIARGDALVTPDAWHTSSVIDIRRVSGISFDEVPEHLTAHVGTAAVPARLRPLGPDHARLTLDRKLPLSLDDRVVLRDPGRRILGGGQIVDPEPPALRRRGDAARRSALLDAREDGDVAAEVARRGATTVAHLRRLGLIDGASATPPGVVVTGDWWIDETACTAWAKQLRDAVAAAHARDPLSAGLSVAAVADLLALPDPALVPTIVAATDVTAADGYLTLPGHRAGLGSAEDAVAALERQLTDHPFRAPESDDLGALGLGTKELAAAERQRRLLRLHDGIVLLPTAPALAMRTLATLEQPFTTSAARQALGTTRRVVIPLLEHLDDRGWTRRLDAGHREVVR